MTENRQNLINNHEYLEVYQIAFNTVLKILKLQKVFPKTTNII
ncbi:MAG: hypothetical protein SWX82_07695 [Cyanobacteriota bacterium]|nr:hypothetical protein [Cyanobacteriota bacterium]